MIKIKRHDGSTEQMTRDEYARWLCLAEALITIEQKAKELKVDSKKLKKSLAIGEYITARYPAMRHDVDVEISLGNL